MENRKHYIAAVSAFVIWGFFALPLRALKGYGSGEILFFRIVFSAIVLAVVIIGFRRQALRAEISRFKTLSLSEKKAAVFLTLIGGLLLTVNWLTFIYIVNHINIKTASFSYMICPVITAVLGYFLIKENLGVQQWIAVALCGISCVVMGMNSSLELGYSVLTAFTYALYLITQRRNQGFDRVIVLGIQVLFALIVLSLFNSLLIHEVPHDPAFYGFITIIAVVFTVFPLFLNLFALNKINSATIGILMYLNPLINFTIAFVVFGEKASVLQIVGYVIIIGALILFNLHNFKRLQAGLQKV
jgi:chloramphenicol-sensitive protein RarD